MRSIRPTLDSGSDPALVGLTAQAELIATGQLSPRELVESCLARIEQFDPGLNAFQVVLAEQALEQAERAAKCRDRGETRPLLGVPLAVKDDVDVAGQVTGMGTCATGRRATADAEVVRRLRGAGAIVIGKTRLPELLMWPFTESTHGGATRNPWDPALTAGGSSGGSAVAVAAGMVGAALGSDGGGSIRIPAACCGIFGLKPQRDRISLAPLAEHWYGLSAYGPLTRTVEDAALFLDVSAPQGRPDFFRASARREPGRLRVGVSTRIPAGVSALLRGRHPEPLRAVEEMATTLSALGHEVVACEPAYGTIALDETVRYLAGLREDAEHLERPELLERRTRAMLRVGALVGPRTLRRSRARGTRHAARLASLFTECDVLLTPALASPPIEVAVTQGRGAGRSVLRSAPMAAYTTPWNVTGQPAAAVPAGFTADGVPLSAQFVGRPHDEATLLSLAAQLESELGWPERWPAPA